MPHWTGSLLTVSMAPYVWCYCPHTLTHWGRVTHICVGKLTIIGSDNGLAPGWCQAIIWTSVRILLIGHLGLVKKSQWNSDQNSNIFIQQNVFENVLSKMAAILSRPQCAKGRLQKMGQCPLVDKITYIFGVKVIGPSRTNYSNIQTKHKQFL